MNNEDTIETMSISDLHALYEFIKDDKHAYSPLQRSELLKFNKLINTELTLRLTKIRNKTKMPERIKDNPRSESVDMLTLLKRTYEDAPRGEQVTAVLMFGIKYADLVELYGVNRLVTESGLPFGYAPELAKAIKLSKYVKIR